MKQLLILSGKGGTGKTTMAGAFIKLSNAQGYADCDVDAPNLHLLMNRSDEAKNTDYYGMPKADIDIYRCTRCGKCKSLCRFDAIEIAADGAYFVNIPACEGCGVCSVVCPDGVISMVPSISGSLKLYQEGTVFSTAQLKMGSGNSGKLVTEVKKQLLQSDRQIDFAVVDGSPGIGCPVIASMSGVDAVLIVAEPSVSGISDLERILKTAGHFHVPAMVCVNKADLNAQNTEKIEQYCMEHTIPFVGKIPFDNRVHDALNKGLSAVDVDCPAGTEINRIFGEISTRLFLKNHNNKNEFGGY